MARSLRSLAGFCMGEYGDFDPEIILLQLLLIIKIFSPPTALQYAVFRYPRYPKKPAISDNLQFLQFCDIPR